MEIVMTTITFADATGTVGIAVAKIETSNSAHTAVAGIQTTKNLTESMGLEYRRIVINMVLVE
jgi:hypothetical protein